MLYGTVNTITANAWARGAYGKGTAHNKVGFAAINNGYTSGVTVRLRLLTLGGGGADTSAIEADITKLKTTVVASNTNIADQFLNREYREKDTGETYYIEERTGHAKTPMTITIPDNRYFLK